MAAWLNPTLARLAVRLDERPDRRPGATCGSRCRCRRATGRGWCERLGREPLRARHDDLPRPRRHPRGGAALPRPAGLGGARPGPPGWTGAPTGGRVAERLAFGPVDDLPDRARRTTGGGPARRHPARVPTSCVHADLAGNVLLDAAGAPVVIDVAPAWRPVRWAEAVCVLDSVLWFDADAGGAGGVAQRRRPAGDAARGAVPGRSATARCTTSATARCSTVLAVSSGIGRQRHQQHVGQVGRAATRSASRPPRPSRGAGRARSAASWTGTTSSTGTRPCSRIQATAVSSSSPPTPRPAGAARR